MSQIDITTDNFAWLLGYGYQMWRCPNLQAELENIYKYLFPVLKK